MKSIDNIVQEEENVIIINEKNKKWLIKAIHGKKFSMHTGEINLSDIIGLEYGTQIQTHLEKKLWVVKPTIADYIMKIKRNTQIIYPKDLGYLLVSTGIQPGSRVLEAGTGSGALTSLLGLIVKPGHVYTYEVREEFIETAQNNLKKAGVEKNVTIKLKNAVEGFDEKDIDAVFLDLGDPWNLIDQAHDSLKGGGMISVITPTYNQAEKVVYKMNNTFIDIDTGEIYLRRILAREGKTRPATTMIAHTALITTGRKANQKK